MRLPKPIMDITTTFKNIIPCAELLTQLVSYYAIWPCVLKLESVSKSQTPI